MPIVILLALAVVGGVWWHGTRDHDFLKPPSGPQLEMVRAQAALMQPPADHPEDGKPAPAGTAQPREPLADPPAPAVDPGDLKDPPTLALYRDDPPASAGDLLKLSSTLEAMGEIQRALLAAERVMDSAKPDEDQMRTAVGIIRRLRPQLPDWNAEAAAALPVTLHAGTGKSTAILLEPLLRELASEIERASAGILKVTAKVASGRDIPEDMGPPPVAIWLAGPADGTRSTEVISFTVISPETLRDDLAGSLLVLLRGHIGRTTALRIPQSGAADPVGQLRSHVTRLVWLELGSRLNPAEE
ncbi:MAG: hypothetical protein MUF86_00155 [Akkermansiaceae bacterium]|nr:hypothetical protein [Akkermansiaceae bacterium]MCU0776067.1 hypothetical protein [Akkermansiaceae bacterium]